MLADIVEKAERTAGGVTTKTGSCKFCKQAAMRKVLSEWSQEEIDELATETCECVNTRIYTHKKSQREAGMKEKTKAFYKAVFKYWLHERKESIKRIFARRTK